MDHPLFIIALSVLCVGVGIARIGTWIIRRREQRQIQLIHQQVYAACVIAQARAELAATGWTVEDEASYQSDRIGARK